MTSKWNLQAALSKEEGNAFRKNTKLFLKYASLIKGYDLGNTCHVREIMNNIKLYETKLDFYDGKMSANVSARERRVSEEKKNSVQAELVNTLQKSLIIKNNPEQMTSKIDHYFINLKAWDESFDPKEVTAEPPPPPRKRRTGFRRRMKPSHSMSMLLAAASHSFTDISKCRYLRGKNAEIDFDKFDTKETLAVNRNKIITVIESDDEETDQSAAIVQTSGPPTRTADIMKELNIRIEPIV